MKNMRHWWSILCKINLQSSMTDMCDCGFLNVKVCVNTFQWFGVVHYIHFWDDGFGEGNHNHTFLKSCIANSLELMQVSLFELKYVDLFGFLWNRAFYYIIYFCILLLLDVVELYTFEKSMQEALKFATRSIGAWLSKCDFYLRGYDWTLLHPSVCARLRSLQHSWVI